MKNRKLSLVSSEIGELLVKQIAHELKNYNLYMSFSNYFGVEGIADLEEYYSHRAEEELNHHKWIKDYLTDGDYTFMYPSVEVNTEVPKDMIDPFRFTVDREIETTQLIYRIYEAALSEKDYMTAQWLSNTLIKEQVEEENTSRTALCIMEDDSPIFDKAEEILALLL